ncbi:MAG: glucose-6-phosphate isomerase [Sandarakinorhabdus sp.]
MDLLAAVTAQAAGQPVDILHLFATEPDRLARLSLDVAGIHADLSRLALPLPMLDQLLAAAAAADLAGWRARLVAGDIVNPSENRPATHMAERGSGRPEDVAAAAAAAAQVAALAAAIRASDVADIIHIGIGGSSLGPALLLDALGRDGDGPRVHVVSNIDGEALARTLSACDPARARLVVVSKTFTTAETMTNAQTALDWWAAAGVEDARAQAIAITARPDRAAAWGAGSVLPFAESVGGRYSLWSAVGLPLAIRCGPEALAALRAGAAAMDAHFLDAPFAANLPVIAGLADVWAAHVQGQPTRGVFCYDDRLRLLPSYLQQLEMESNGKSVTREGEPVSGLTAPITWGGTGTDAQHAVFQLLHQGTVVGPIEFVAVREPGHALPATHHQQLLANCFAQGAALLKGRSFAAALALSGGDPALARAKTFSGNRPSSTLLLDRLDPHTLGALIALYEHRVFVAAVLLGINPYDQWGVELGKEMANAMLAGDDLGFDPSTADLLARAGL